MDHSHSGRKLDNTLMLRGDRRYKDTLDISLHKESILGATGLVAVIPAVLLKSSP